MSQIEAANGRSNIKNFHILNIISIKFRLSSSCVFLTVLVFLTSYNILKGKWNIYNTLCSDKLSYLTNLKLCSQNSCNFYKCQSFIQRFVVLISINKQLTVCWDVRPCILLEIYLPCRGTCHFHLAAWRWMKPFPPKCQKILPD